VHPIERLRFVAGARGVPGDVLAVEAAQALCTFSDDPAGLTAACRRVLARQVTCGPLWWVCARLLTSESVRDCAWESIQRLQADTTEAEVSLALATRAPDSPSVLAVQALAFGSDGAFVAEADAEELDRRAEAEAWLVGGVGVHLAEPLWEAARAHRHEGGARTVDVVPLSRFVEVFGPTGAVPTARLGHPDCPSAPELLRLAG
jgi:hypothetical protein